MEVKFHISQDGRVPKRKYAKDACDACRQRKKKCYHERSKRHQSSPLASRRGKDTAHDGSDINSLRSMRAPVARSHDTDGIGGSQRLQAPRMPVDVRPSNSQDLSRPPQTDRFLCDLNPVIFFVDDTNARLVSGRSNQRDVGIWLDRDSQLLVSGGESHSEDLPPGETSHQTSGQRANIRRAVLLPPRQSQEALVNIYLRRIHPILPLIDEHEFQREFNEGCASPYLVQVMCLAASKDDEAAPFLRLANSNALTRCEFSNSLYDELTHAVALRLERKRVTLIQVLALLSLHVRGPRSFEDASLYLVQAAHHAQTMGLHLTGSGPVQKKKSLIALFWSLWALDRFCAAIQGRSLIIHDRDLGQQFADVVPLFEAPFRVFLSLASALADVFVVYRPSLQGPVDPDKPEIPRFEDIIQKCAAWNLPRDTILSLELSYHAIALLASRPWILKDQPKSDILYLRQDLSVYRMVSLIQICDPSQLLPLPIVPYALSLGFCVAYKQTKRCHLPSTQETAKQHLQVLYRSLEALSPTWWSAQVMIRVGQRALNEIQRTARPNDLSKTQPSAQPEAEYISTPLLTSGSTASESAERAAEAEQRADFATGNDTFNYISDDTALDIDDLLGNFLNISVPTCPTRSSFTDFDMAWNDQAPEYANFY